MLYWVFGSIIAFAALVVYLEYASLFPNRSGGQVTYLEQAYPRPAFLFPVAYAFFIVVFSFSASNAVVLARYIYRAAEHEATDWENKGLAMGSYTFLAILCLLSNRWSLRLLNVISAVKLIILLFIVITGFVVLGGGTKVQDSRQNFRNSFEGVTNNGNDVVNALVSINFAYTGYANAFNVVAEIKVCNTVIHTCCRGMLMPIGRTLFNLSSGWRPYPWLSCPFFTFSPMLHTSLPFQRS